MKDNPYWEGSPTALVALINVDIQPHVITRKLNVLAGRLYARAWDSLSELSVSMRDET